MHVHVTSHDGEAKFWLEPIIALANYYNLTAKQLNELQRIVEEHSNDITEAWKTHFHS